MTEAMCLTDSGLHAIREAKASARSAEEFVRLVDAIVANDALLPLPFSSEALPDLANAGDRHHDEVSNAIEVYEALGALPRVAAADPRLWTYLAVGPYREYMLTRWPISGIKSWSGRLADRWIVSSASLRPLIRHGISRLWWLAELTFDPHCHEPLSQVSGDPWAYLKVALAKEEHVVAVFEREVGTIPFVRRALLEYLAREEPRDEEIRKVMKELVLAYGFKELSALDAAQARALVDALIPAKVP